jgi:hypothetical protein
MDNQAKQTLKKGILGNQSENPYGNMGEMTSSEEQVNHQEAFEAQMKQTKNNKQTNINIDSQTYAFEQNGTYCRTGNFENGFIETDLKIVKQKGVEERCVSFTIINQAEVAELYEDNNLIVLKMEMSSEEQFNNFKKFVASLEWND